MFSRKQWRSKPTPNTDSQSNSHESNKSSRSLFSLSRAQSKTSNPTGGQAEGSLGLSLLRSATTPKIDLIFVHGLGGNSRKTWSKSSRFWPAEWLPLDPEFNNVRIHTYGYDSQYLKGNDDCWNIHHIGKSLLGAISTSPCIANSDTCIVVIGHSMGGLVLKKAYILANQDALHKTLARRFAAFYFLATPHRGADSATMLKNLLRLIYDRAYIGDLERNSGAVQVINDEFRHFSAGLELWSFYETQTMKHFNSLIVDPESAVLGYPEEKQIPMTADHRSICKFDTPEDPNYVLLRNALASTVKMITTASSKPGQQHKRDRIRALRKYLDVPDMLDDDLANVCDARMSGSCGWISTKDIYCKWRDGDSGRNATLWIKGKPAAGKSVLAGYVIDQLKENNQACSYFFFKHGNKLKSKIGPCLRSLAFQMAQCDDEASHAILDMEADGVSLDRIDERSLWRVLFLSGIFPAITTRQYWVIDALDECSNPSVLLQTILSSLEESIPLRILITSRDTADLGPGFLPIPANSVQSFSILAADTEPDLRLLIEKKTQTLGVVQPEDRATLAEKILTKSSGSFLWTTLVLEELLRCHSTKEVHHILEDVPRGMELLYRRTLDNMSQATRGKDLTKAILTWTACAVRPMTVGELSGALTWDISDSFPRLEESIAALCGQLVSVDKYGRVNMVHETAREFLVANEFKSEFTIEKAKAHTRMAQACLKYLTGEEMKPLRNSRRRPSANLRAKRVDFASYAFTAYSDHLSRADAGAAETFQLIVQFLKSNVLTWIESVAESRHHNQLTRASKHLKVYINACAAERSPLDPRIQELRQWAIDLARIPAMFSSALTVSPSAIYSLIPPFCPTGSMIYKIGATGRRIAVLGAPHQEWDDRLLCIDFRQGQPRVLRYGDEHLAVGLSSGIVILYYTTSYQEYKVLEHGEAVQLIAFQTKSSLMAACGMKMIKVWDIKSGQVIYNLASPPRPLGMEFSKESLLVASRSNYFATIDLGREESPVWVQKPWSNIDPLDTGRAPPQAVPRVLTICPSHGMLAVAYSGQPIMLWDMEEDVYAGSCGKKLSSGETSTHAVVALAFNPNPDIGLLAVAYLDGDLALLDPFSDQQLECFRANCQTLSSSPNGRFLATGAANGIINVYEFDTFKLLYRVKSSNSFIKQLAFTKDSMLLADLQGTQCTVWEPEALLPESLADDSSGPTTTTMVEAVSVRAKARITAVAVHHTSEVIFCGKDDGSVVMYESKRAKALRAFYSHKSPLRLLTWIKSRDALLSIDASNRIFLHKIQRSADKGWLSDPTILFESRLESEKAITDVLVGETAAKFLVSTRESDHLFNLDSVCVDCIKIGIYSWDDWIEVSSAALLLDKDWVELKHVILCSEGPESKIVLHLLHTSTSLNVRSIAVIDTDCLKIDKQDTDPVLGEQSSGVAAPAQQAANTTEGNMITTPRLASPLRSRMATFEISATQIIGVDESKRLVFLDQSFWVCSLDLRSSEVVEHFFVPYDWFAGSRDVVSALAKRDIILTRGGDLAVIRGGLEHIERVRVKQETT